MNDISESIKDILRDELFVEHARDEMDPDESLRSIFGLDSLGFVELRVQLEERFGVTISDEEFSPENFASINSVTALVHRLRSVPA